MLFSDGSQNKAPTSVDEILKRAYENSDSLSQSKDEALIDLGNKLSLVPTVLKLNGELTKLMKESIEQGKSLLAQIESTKKQRPAT